MTSFDFIKRAYYTDFMQRILSFIFIFTLVIILPSFNSSLGKEADFGIAQYLPIEDKEVRAGSIISSTSKGFFLSRKLYDNNVIGVVSDKPAISFDITQVGSKVKRYQVVTVGTVGINVSTMNGAVKKGDLVTSSIIPGVGMKATRTGFVLGTALDNMTSSNPQEVKKVNVVLNLRTVSSASTIRTPLLDLSNLSALALLEDPILAFRYILAALILLLSFILGFVAFGRVASRGVEAIGRNPLAARMIQLGVALNVLVTIAIIGAGIVVAILILTL